MLTHCTRQQSECCAQKVTWYVNTLLWHALKYCILHTKYYLLHITTTMSDDPTTAEWIRLFALPATVGAITALLSAFISWLKSSTERARTNRQEQLSQAKKVCFDILGILDELHSYFQHDAWYAAWRRRKRRHLGVECIEEDVALMESDAEKWKAYETALMTWRKQDIIFETQLEAFFQVDDFDELRKLIDTAAEEMWHLYYTNDKNLPYSKEAKEASRQHFGKLLRRIRVFIKILSLHLIKCIQQENVGNLRFDTPCMCLCQRSSEKRMFHQLERRNKKECKMIDQV
jgi:hypothetical protein